MDEIEIEKLVELAKKAGDAILEIYRQDFDVEKKSDHSPITIADKKSNDIITQELKTLTPDIPIISEESKQTPFEVRKKWDYLWMVDPLDGTKEFIKKNGEFTVNIALIHKGKPVVGVVYIPVTRVSYYAIKGKGSFKTTPAGATQKLTEKHDHYSKKTSLKVVASRSHLSDEVKQFVEKLQEEGKTVDFVSSGSSIKFCLVAEGSADVYPRFGPTMEWDTAAAQIVATEAGRKVVQAENGQPLQYNKENLLNPWFVVE